jgi:hypothetical protein
LEQTELLDFIFIWKGKCSSFISTTKKQYNESSVPRNNNGATFVPDFVTSIIIIPRQEILICSSVSHADTESGANQGRKKTLGLFFIACALRVGGFLGLGTPQKG